MLVLARSVGSARLRSRGLRRVAHEELANGAGRFRDCACDRGVARGPVLDAVAQGLSPNPNHRPFSQSTARTATPTDGTRLGR